MKYVFRVSKEMVDSLKDKIDLFIKKPKLEELSKENIDLMIDILIEHFVLEQNALGDEIRGDITAILKSLNSLKKAHAAFDEFKTTQKTKKEAKNEKDINCNDNFNVGSIVSICRKGVKTCK